ncbi:hypothetical protein SGCZBJ_04505 [Caulobacter zeae]|uniref:DUF4893 domain-containing protein n=1 Tax=Caulobacter zeae TaxID=2055137 RepID=A0A2N5DQD8_9CAUL|nr:hypothetical protein [Caulobacter zeae]PLR28270.1 hypothetical protein SGCZBJ_04505 [Caulobacter zeae]
MSRSIPAILLVAAGLASAGLTALPATAQQAKPAAPPLAIPPVQREPLKIAPANRPTPAAPIRFQLPKTWDDLPPSVQQSLTPMLDKAPPQSRLVVEQALEPLAARSVDQRTVIGVQVVRPAPGVTLTKTPDEKPRLGAAGEALWPAVIDGRTIYCRRQKPAAGDVYCFADKDDDGRFETLTRAYADSLRPGSVFQITEPGRPEKLLAPAPYTKSGATAPFTELLGLRYGGPVQGRISPDGKLRNGVVEFQVVAGASRDALFDGDAQIVEIEDGKGELILGAYRIEISDVTIDGPATVRLISGMAPGETMLSPPLGKEDVVRMLRERLGATD